MRVVETKSGFLIRLDPGEEIIENLSAFVEKRNIGGGSISGIGAVLDTTLGYFDLHQKIYDRKVYADDMELVSFVGNISWIDGKPMVHAHASLSGPDYQVVGGHLFSATVAVTGEFYLYPIDERIERAPDPRSGLNLIADA